MIAGYDPARIPVLRWHATAARWALNALTSTDPAANEALGAVQRLRRALDADVLPAVAAIEHSDPLVRTGAWHAPRIDVASPPRVDRHTQWFEQASVTPFSEHLLIDLFVLLGIEMTQLLEKHGTPGFDDPFWSEEFPDLVAEFERRTAGDPAVAAALIAEAAHNPMIGLIVGAGNFDAELVTAVTTATLSIELVGGREDQFVTEAIAALLTNVVDMPTAALNLLTQPGVIDALFGWNLRFQGGGELPGEVLADLIINGLVVAPDLDDDLLPEAARVLAEIMAVSADLDIGDVRNGEAVAALAIAFAAHGPAMLDSLITHCNVQMRHGDTSTHLGTHDEVAAFLAQLVTDPIARAVLTGMVHDLASQAEPGSTGPTPEQISALGVLLDTALDAANDQLGAAADAMTARIGFTTTLAKFLAGRLAAASGVGAFTSFVVSMGIGAAGDRVADRVSADTVGAPAFDVLADLIIELELLRDAIENPQARRLGVTPAQVAAARAAVEALDQLFASGPVPFHEIERLMVELRRAANLVTEPVDFTPYHPREVDASDHPCDDASLVDRA